MDLILERELEAGDPLPTENELAAALGVGRNTLRESLKVLQALGVIEIRHGFGMFVAPSNFEALADGLTFRARLSLRHHGQEALQLVDVRQALESGLIGSAMDLMTAGAAGRRRGIRGPDGGAGCGRGGLRRSGRGIPPPAVRTAEQRAAAQPAGCLLEGLPQDPPRDRRPAPRTWRRRRRCTAGIYEAVAAGDKALAAERLTRHFDGIRRRISDAVARTDGAGPQAARHAGRCRSRRALAPGRPGLKQKIRTGEPVRIFSLCAQRDSNP